MRRLKMTGRRFNWARVSLASVLLACMPSTPVHALGVEATYSLDHLLLGRSFSVEVAAGRSRAGDLAVLQSRVANSRWTDLKDRRLDPDGQTSFIVRPGRAAIYDFRILVPRDGGQPQASSPPVTIPVRRWRYLMDLEPVDNQGSYWEGPVDIDGTTFSRSVFSYAASRDGRWVEYNLGRKCITYRATHGLDDDSQAEAAAELSISIDSQTRATNTLNLGQSAPINTSISRGLRLRLTHILVNGGDAAHEVVPAFGNARVLCAS